MSPCRKKHGGHYDTHRHHRWRHRRTEQRLVRQAQHPNAGITVLEAGPQFGGVKSPKANGCQFEAGQDSIIRTKPAGMQLIKDLGLESELIGTAPDLAGSL